MPFIPPWMARDYDPIGAFQRSLQVGAQIGEAQTRIAEQQRQANMEHAAKQQAMQANILKAQQEMEMEKAYRQQQLSLENARLEETKQRNLQAGLQAAASLKEREAFHQGELKKKMVSHYKGGLISYDPETGEVQTLKEPEATPARPSETEKSTQRMAEKEADALFTRLQKVRDDAGTPPKQSYYRKINEAYRDFSEAARRATNAPTATATSPGAVPIPAPTAATVTPAPAAPAATKKLTNEAARMYWDRAKAILKTWKKPSEITEKAAELAKADGWTL